ncbi:nickel pincer cofactor biosynthesis protein LarC [Mycobacterium pyrenivorans]|nr:nickel pincer cofactor biosynthesis protein LarC [Mycolicibacterium pyrenivorans]MCV7152755.1 nickel pincer cofactor biosynthesis protein LarC [Mycolicibacterium pyrenivorans]
MRHSAGLHLWVDATAGIAGDMLLGALIDAGAALDTVESAVSAVVPGEVALRTSTVHRAGLRALKIDVESRTEDHPHRSWARIRTMLEAAELPGAVRTTALAVFARLADAEGRVHGVATDDVHFHEVGSWDSIADIVGACAALAGLGVTRVTASPVAVGSGRIGSAHGDLPVPPPAVLELARGWRILAGGEGELATPTGMALIRALADECGSIGPMEITALGVGAGGRDVPGRANVVRVVLGVPVVDAPTADSMWVLETNVDDLDPRVWPTVLAALLEAGAADAWLVPILMKKGRPAHTLCVLARDAERAALRDTLFRLTSTIGVREAPVSRVALDRGWQTVELRGGEVRIKVAVRAGRIVHATPEFDDAAALATARDLPVRQVLDESIAAAEAAMLRPGLPWSGEPREGDDAAT